MVERTDLLAVLEAADDPVHAEFPGGPDDYDWRAAWQLFSAFADAARNVLGQEAEVWSGPMIQDASFVGEIRIPPDCTVGAALAVVRVSHFGPFIAVLEDEAQVLPELLEQLQRLAAKHGYRWIPSDLLALPYTGRNRGINGFPTWARRFFDWI